MITLEQYEQIRRMHYLEEKSGREIARATASKKVDSLNGKEEKFESSFPRKDTRNWLSAPPPSA